MKRIYLLIIIIFMVLVPACGSRELTTEEKIIGRWSGMLETDEGDPFPSEWQFMEDGNLVMIVAPGTLNAAMTATYSIDEDVMTIQSDEEGAAEGRRIIEFVGDDTVKLIAVNARQTVTLTRIKEEE